MDNLFSQEGPIARAANLIWDLIIVSILWFVCSLPLITLGAASTAAYYTCAKVLRHHNGRIFTEFFRSFRLNFKQSTAFTLISCLVLLVLVLDCIYFYSSSAFFLYLFYLMIGMWAAFMVYFYPLLSRFSMTVFRFFRMAAVLTFRHLLTSILLLVLLTCAALGIYLVPWGILVLPGLGFWISTYLMEPILRACAPKPEEGSEESEKWYYR